jgi:hypothetical protein
MTVEALHERYDYGRLPPHLQGGVRRYIEKGIPPGDFLTAVITNDLFLAISHADSTSLAALPDIVRFFYNESPSGCWGTPEKMKAWMQTGHKKNIV